MDLNNIKLTLPGKKKKGKLRLRDMPVKRSINLAVVNEKPFNFRLAIPAIILIILGAIALSKFAVADRLIAMSQAQGEVASLQAELNADYDVLRGMNDLSDRYAHYTYSGMTQEELDRTDRVKVLQLLQKVIIPQAEVSNWTVSGNLLTLNLNRSSLQDINLLVQELNEHWLVDYCTVTTASAGDRTAEGGGKVTAQVLVYLKANTGETTEESETTESEGDVVGEAIDSLTDTVLDNVAGDVAGDLQAGKEALESNEDLKS